MTLVLLLVAPLLVLGCSGSKTDAESPASSGGDASSTGPDGETATGPGGTQDGDEPSGPADEDIEVPPAP